MKQLSEERAGLSWRRCREIRLSANRGLVATEQMPQLEDQ